VRANSPKRFDCVEFKRSAQEGIAADVKGMSPEEELKYFRTSVKKGPLGRWWRSLEKRKVAV